MVSQSLIVHGHFYQPPREDPLTGFIPQEDGAVPFLNWNERIHAECYFPNAQLGNFEKISFNVGPTLYEWMEKNHPATNSQIIMQDKANVLNHGVGNAIAQPYHHTILPLSSRKDKITQIVWGITQFESRFKRKPEGMWLPETAVDMETLEILAEQGIQFTILAPWQADQSAVDCTEPYQIQLGSGKNITAFFYQQYISAGISFSPALTSNADQFLEELIVPNYSPEKLLRGEPQLLLVASDGELYGHHQQFRDLFLAHLMNGASQKKEIQRTYPALWLKQHPSRQFVELRENTSWSCHHGVERWKGDCACIGTDGQWKKYLRQACDQLAFETDTIYAEFLKPFQIDPWELRNRFIFVKLGIITPDQLIDEMAGRVIPSTSKAQIGLMLEAQFQRQRMFTSCGWFFEDFDRIEPKNCLAYAVRVIHLTEQATGDDLSPSIHGLLTKVVSQRSGLKGDVVFDRQLARAKSI